MSALVGSSPVIHTWLINLATKTSTVLHFSPVSQLPFGGNQASMFLVPCDYSSCLTLSSCDSNSLSQLQFCFLLIVYWKLVTPPPNSFGTNYSLLLSACPPACCSWLDFIGIQCWILQVPLDLSSVILHHHWGHLPF